MNLSKKQKEERVLTVIYRLSGGVAGVPIKKIDLLKEINDLGVMDMAENEFQVFKATEVKKAQAARN